jgi:hypothetical protein
MPHDLRTRADRLSSQEHRRRTQRGIRHPAYFGGRSREVYLARYDRRHAETVDLEAEPSTGGRPDPLAA